jgi:signal peptidase II
MNEANTSDARPAAQPSRLAVAVTPLTAAASGWRWLPLSAAVILVDHLVKAWIQHHFVLFDRVHVLPVLDIILTYNTGAAFSMFAGGAVWVRWALVALALVVSLLLIVWLRRLNGRLHALLCCGLALIVGGALGNMLDRLAIGRVIDFVHVHWGGAYFPAFNVADSAITIGAVLLLIDAWRESRATKRLSI